MTTISVNVPETVSVNIKHHTENLVVSLAEKSPEWWGWITAFAIRQSAGDADAGLKEETDAKRKEAVRAKFDKIAQGHVPSGGSGPGKPRLTFDVVAERAVLADFFMDELGENKTTATASAAKANAWERVTWREILKQATAAGFTAETIKGMNKASLIEENLETVRGDYAEAIEEKAKLLAEAAAKGKNIKTSGLKIG